MNKYLDYLKGDRVIWIITLLMLAFSLVTVYSFVPILVKIEGGSPFKYLFKHFVYVLIGVSLMIWVHRQDPKHFSMFSKVGFYVAVGLLLFTFFFTDSVNGANRWVRIPFLGLTFQSSDFAKLALIIYLSRLMVKKSQLMHSWKQGFWPIMLPIIIICGLIVKDNFSTAAIVFLICLIMLFLGRIPIGKIATVLIGGAGILTLIVGLHVSVPALNLLPRYETWKNRIFNVMSDETNVAANAQASNAKLGIYNGGILGQGVGDGKLKEYLPEAYADFYYASFVEEFGLFSAIILVLLYLILLFRLIKIGLASDNLFQTYLCIGIGVLILTQASVNMLVCTGFFPVTGQNMPMLAMGGSALIMTCMSIGMIQSIAYHQQKSEKA